jgi:type IV pilus assembly protein PilX
MTRVCAARSGHGPATPGARGIALVTAMIVLAVMSLAAVALTRAVDTVTAVTGNLALRMASVPAADAALEAAIAALADPGVIADPERDDPGRGYYASRQPGEDPRGVPAILQRPDHDADAAPTIDVGEGNVARYVIERLCVAPGAPIRANCALARAGGSGAPEAQGAGASPELPLYRITARVDGPRNTLAYAQAIVRDARAPRRLTWRIVHD